ncbi:MAG TPA: cyclic 2,3-diphosphoglycerate synthase [Candidatus Deferrimicrobium sp.]|nr:cyclic 2,3-diphosphoglycerate synthase [Candidatus Deferrimicrobium sp.]
MKKRVLIMGAAGRDFHNFNVVYRDNPDYEVVAFTATQIPGIDDKKYPAALAGKLYPSGIPIYPESDLDKLIAELNVDEVVFAYSDQPHVNVMHKASQVLADGADFTLLGPKSTEIKSTKPVISICAVRTGSGKSQTSRAVVRALRAAGKKVVSIRHPMPYGDLAAQACERFATYADLDKYKCTIEEREEYEPHIDMGAIIYAGVDYEMIVREAEKEADVIIWDGGNNDFSFYVPDLKITVADPLRAGNELTYYPGETNFRQADVIVINKVDSATPAQLATVRENMYKVNPKAIMIEAASPVFVQDPDMIRGKRVLVIEDGPTLTHGEMTYGAGYVAAMKYGAAEIIDPHPYAVGSIKATFEKYTQKMSILPAMGYSDEQIEDLRQTIEATPCDVVVMGTPIDLLRVLKLSKPSVRVTYELQEIGTPTIADVLKKFGLV